MRAFDCADQAICDDENPGGPSIASNLALFIRKTGDDRVELEFPTEAGRVYAVERSLNLLPGTWSDVDTVPGSGLRVKRPYPIDPREAYFRVREEADGVR